MRYSFIIPLFNTKISALDKCIKSVINQNIENYEIIVVNDGSSDKDLNNYCEKIIKKNKNLKYFYQINSGSAVARNYGIKFATGDYIVFIDADDELEQSFFDKIKKIELSDITIFDYCCVDRGSSIIHSFGDFNINFKKCKNDIYANICFFPGKMNDFMFGSIWGKIFSTKYLKKNKISFVPRLRKAQDRVFMLHAFSNTNNINYYPILMYKYKLNNQSITHKMNLKMNEYYCSLYEEMSLFAANNKLDEYYIKFLSYNILNELLPLTIFNVDYKEKYQVVKKKLICLIEKYNVNNSIKKIHYGDIPTKKGKIKLFLYKNKLYYLLYKIIYNMQRKERNRLIK